MKLIAALISSLIVSPSFAADKCPAPAAAVLKKATQLLVVTPKSFNDKRGTLRLWERATTKDAWQSNDSAHPMVLGKNGVGWGYRYQSIAKPGQPLKHEGDGRSPAGVHPLGKRFGFDPTPGLDYIPLTAATFCVDDASSRFYNRIVDATQVKKDWTSAEDMSRIEVYRYGMNIEYDSSAAQKTGSCIFLHIWSAPDAGTAGCVSMQEAVIVGLHGQLSAARSPAIAILPASEWSSWSDCFPGAAAN